MREVLFRIWDKELEEMNHESLPDIAEGEIWYDGETDCWSVYDDATTDQERFVLMQYTGLKDMDGRKIYEGDIVKWVDAKPSFYLVEFIEGAFCLVNKRREGYPIDINIVYPSIGCRIKVVGNSCQNNELFQGVE